MKDFEIRLTPEAISIKTVKTKTLFDADGNEVTINEGNHRQALSLRQFDSPEEFRAALNELVGDCFGKDLGALIADIRLTHDQCKKLEGKIHKRNERIDQLTKENEQLQANVDNKHRVGVSLHKALEAADSRIEELNVRIATLQNASAEESDDRGNNPQG